MDLKLVKIASVRENMDAYYRGEISYSKAVELINEDANKQLMLGGVEGRSEQLPNMSLEQAIAKAKPNLDKIKDVDKHLDDIK